MISKKMMDAINSQINEELFSSYLYLSMSAWFESENLKGFAKWMRVQADEERAHAMKFFDYLIDRGGNVTLKAIEAPGAKWTNPLAAFQETLKHEQKITSLINGLVDLAAAEKDHASSVLLNWYVSEQVEEEANATQIVETLKMIKDSVGGLFQLDHHLGKRGE